MLSNLLLPFLLTLLPAMAALNPNCAPGGNFDLSNWTLQLPIGSPGKPQQEYASDLVGCGGYQDPGHHYFFTESGDGALVMKVPGSPASSGCVTTPNSEHCRTELREADPKSWSPLDARNSMTVTLAVEQADDSQHGTAIGQIHIADTVSSKPVCEIYYNTAGDVAVGVEHTIQGNQTVGPPLFNVPVGQKFTYTLSYQSNVLSLALNGGTAKPLPTYDLDAPDSYFKVGNYNQGDSPSDVHFFAISVSH